MMTDFFHMHACLSLLVTRVTLNSR